MLVIDDFGWFCELLQQYSINAGVPQDTILGPTLLHYALVIFLVILSQTLLSILLILLFTQNMIGFLTGGNS